MTGGNSYKNHKFYEYYAKASQSQTTLQRFLSIQECVLRIIQSTASFSKTLEVADIGCGAGTQSLMWAELGHHVHGLDVNESLLELAKERAARAEYSIDYRLGSAEELPWADESMDVCLALELLEHVTDWNACLLEFTRILRIGGVLFLTTTNKLCPIQQEFELPLYSWYPGPLKRYFENLAMTTRPELANFAKYPAVNWFSFYGLRRLLTSHGFLCLDRFDVVDLAEKSSPARIIIRGVRTVRVLRWLAHVATKGTTVLAIRKNGARE